MEWVVAALGSAALVVWAAIWLALAAVMLAADNPRPVRALKSAPANRTAGAS